MALDLRVVSLSPRLGVLKILLKNYLKKLRLLKNLKKKKPRTETESEEGGFFNPIPWGWFLPW